MALALLAALAIAQPSLADCRVIDDAGDRLACYDQVAGRAPMEQGKSMSEASRPVLAAPLSEEQRRAAFEEKSRLLRSGEAPAINAAPTNIEVMSNGKLRITLDNGQEWRQLSSDRPFRVNSKKPPKAVEITEAALGSYRLRFDDSRQSLRVQREQ